MHILIRAISPYTAADLLLGVFQNRDDAEHTRSMYIDQYENRAHVDTWVEQAYVEKVDFYADVKILDGITIVNISETAKEVYVISQYIEGFGQIIRNFKAVCGTEKDALAVLKNLKIEGGDDFPNYFEIDVVEIGKLLSDTE